MHTMKQIADEAQKVYGEIYTVEDTLKGNSIEMHKEARKIAVERLKERDEINDDLDELERYNGINYDECRGY